MRNNEDRIGAQKQIQSDVPPQVLQQQGLTINFIAPTEYVDLPSGGKYYPEGHPLKNKQTIEIKQMTAKEEDILTNRSFMKKGLALEKLLEALVIDKSINTQELLVCDRNAIFLAARISAYGSEYNTQVTCPACEKKSKYQFNLLEKLEEQLSEENNTEINESGTFFVTLPSTKWTVECKALNGSDEKKLLNAVSSKTKEEFTLLDQLKMLVVSVQGTNEKEIVLKALETMPASDSRYLRKQYESLTPSFELKGTFTCSDCEHEEVLEVPLTAEFFWPK